MITQNQIKTVLTLAAVAMAVFAGPAQALEAQLGLLDLTKDYGAGAGNNPATENPWALGDPYHLIYVTSTTTTAESNDISTYNAFVQADANAEGIGASVGVTWSVLGSTADVNAQDNAVITGPVFGIYDSKYVALDANDFWDYMFPAGSLILQLDGSGKNVHTGTHLGLKSGAPLGNPAPGNVEREWSAWQNWRDATGFWDPNTEAEMVALSDPLVIGGGDPNAPTVDAGDDMITWSGEPVELDPNVVGGEPPFTYLWTAVPDDGVVFDPGADVEEPNVTITKPALVSTAVAIVNPGFELPALDDGEYTNGFADCPGWSDVNATLGGVWNPGLGGTTFPGHGGNAPEGENVAYVTSSGIEQVLTETVEAETTYTLTVEVGNNAGALAGYKVQLLAGGTLLDEDDSTLTIGSDEFKTSTVTYTSGADAVADPNVGQALQIRLLNGVTGEANFDDVQLTAEGSVPEPYIVTLTLTVDDVHKNAMTIDVYDDACKAARIGKGLAPDNPGDFDEDCITDFGDLAELAAKWLTHGGLAGPVLK